MQDQTQEQINQLQTTINSLKVRLFDANEVIEQNGKTMNEVMAAIIRVLGVVGDASGNVQLNDILTRAQELRDIEEASKSDAPSVGEESHTHDIHPAEEN